MKKIFVFDVSNIFYRAFFGNDRLTTSYGMPTQGLYGFLRMIHSIVRDHRPDLIAFAMEGEGESKRKTIYPLYKANRSAPNPDLKLQLQHLPELMQVMGYPVFRYPNYEADDTIGTLVKTALVQGLQPVVVSSDKDFCQLLTDQRVTILNPATGEYLNDQGVYLKYSINASQFIDYLSIVGDSSDNIQGVKGIGDKGAAKLLAEYGTLDNIYACLDQIKGANLKKLTESREQVFKARELVTLLDVPMVADLQTVCSWGGPRYDEARTLFRKYEFQELERMLLGATNVVTVAGVEIGVRR